MNFSNLLSKMLVLFLFIAVGFGCGKGGMIDEHTRKKLNKLVLYLCSPALILHSVMNSELNYAISDILLLMLFALVYLLVLIVLAYVFVPAIRAKREDRGVFLFAGVFGNCIFMGFPVMSALYGESAIFLASICSMPYNILLYSLGVFFIRGRRQGSGPDWASIFNPAMVATVLAFFVFMFRIRIPAPIVDVCAYLGNMVVPLAMMLIGVSLSSVSYGEIFKGARVYLYCAFKLLIAPAVVFLACRLLISDPLFLGIIVISSAMPAAAICPIFCTEYGGNTLLASKTVFLSTLCSLLTIPVAVSVLLL